MTKTQEKLFQQMIEAIEEENEMALKYELAKRNADKFRSLYKSMFGAEEQIDTTKCFNCGGRIEDYEDIEQTDKEMLYTYKCPHCGFYGVQHHELVYTHTEEVK